MRAALEHFPWEDKTEMSVSGSTFDTAFTSSAFTHMKRRVLCVTNVAQRGEGDGPVYYTDRGTEGDRQGKTMNP